MLIRLGRFALVVLVVAAGAALTGELWLPAIAHALIHPGRPEPAEIVVVLAGDGSGQRLLRAVDLVEQGYAARVLVDGPGGYYGASEADLALRFAERRRIPLSLLDPFPMRATSTIEECRLVDAELRRRGVRKALVVTSDFHTQRARYIFERHASGEIEYVFVPCRTPGFHPDHWWKSREGKKIVFQEWLKTLYSWTE